MKTTLAGLAFLGILATSTAAAAQQAPQYVAPLSQTTQPSYVPQSVALSGPKEISDYDGEEPVPPGYKPVKHVRKGLIISGAVLFGVTYSLSVLAGSAMIDSSGNSARDGALMYIPALGPLAQITNVDSATAATFLLADALAQIAGIAMFATGMSSTKTILKRNDLVGNVHVTPTVTKTGGGFSLTARF